MGALALLTLVLLTMDITGWLNARRDRSAIDQKKAMIAERDQIRANAETFLNRPENRATRDESQFLNQLIERKAFSWTRVLESLEKVMPARVHLVSISPELDDDNQLSIKMRVAGDSRDRAIELMRRMEESRRFAQTQIVSESYAQSPTGDSEQIDIAAIYIPETNVEAPATAADGKPATKLTKSNEKGKAGPKSSSGSQKVELAKRSKH